MSGIGNFGNLMRQAQKQAQKLQKQMEEAQRNLKERVVEGSAGGGMVTVQVNGHKELVAIKIDKEVVNPSEVDMLEDLILAAIHQAMKRAQDIHDDEMRKATGGLQVPGLLGM